MKNKKSAFYSHLIYVRTLPTNVTVKKVIGYIDQVQGFVAPIDYNEESLVELQDILTMNRFTVETFMENLHLQCEELFVRCRFRMRDYNCKDIIFQVRTFLGKCCSFNIQQMG